MPQRRELRTALRSYIISSPDYDAPPGVDIELGDVPVISLLATPIVRPPLPIHGITMHAGISDVPQILQRRTIDAQVHDQQLYEVEAQVRVGFTAPVGALRQADIANLQVLNLQRASGDTSAWLKSLITSQIDEVFGADADNLSIANAVSRHPRLLDELAQHPDLAHVAVILWESAIPRDFLPDRRQGEEPLIKVAKLGTLFTADPSRVELRTLNSDWVRARLPERVGAFPSIPVGRVRRRSDPTPG